MADLPPRTGGDLDEGQALRPYQITGLLTQAGVEKSLWEGRAIHDSHGCSSCL